MFSLWLLRSSSKLLKCCAGQIQKCCNSTLPVEHTTLENVIPDLLINAHQLIKYQLIYCYLTNDDNKRYLKLFSFKDIDLSWVYGCR